ncbi:hypothetical protein LOAG_18454 [Loa loa]|uniref:Uncharacterized protein n=1 Tax=Loa loa TaxID=7209 RepID=A0A1S0UFR0_LOALO|nr:hypothetical protein LOAG_18454 [Loa loa]EJD74198.1 hypothetical protein LOAG_18454 [Loa loa]
MSKYLKGGQCPLTRTHTSTQTHTDKYMHAYTHTYGHTRLPEKKKFERMSQPETITRTKQSYFPVLFPVNFLSPLPVPL